MRGEKKKRKKKKVSLHHLVTNLEVKVTWFGVESQVDAVAVVTDDVFGSRVLTVPSAHKLL